MRIGARLILCLACILLLVATGTALSLWQIHTYEVRVQELDEVAQQVEAVQRVNTDVLAYQQTFQNAAASSDAARFAEIVGPFKTRLTRSIDNADEALQASPASSQKNAMPIAIFAFFRGGDPKPDRLGDGNGGVWRLAGPGTSVRKSSSQYGQRPKFVGSGHRW